MSGQFVPPPTGDSSLKSSFDFVVRGLRQRTDRTIFWLLIAQWGLVLLASFTLAMMSHGMRTDVTWAMVIGAGLLSALPLWIVLQYPGTVPSRWSVTVTQGLLCSLLWTVFGGRPESHLHLFAWIIVLAWYRDRSVIAAVTMVALVGDAAMCLAGYVPMETVMSSAMLPAWLVAVISTTLVMSLIVGFEERMLSEQLRREIDADFELADLRQSHERATRELEEERDRLRGEMQLMAERRASAEAAKTDALRELFTLRSEASRRTATIAKLTSRSDAVLPPALQACWQAVRRESQQMSRLFDAPATLSKSDRGLASNDDTATDQDVVLAAPVRTKPKSLLVIRNALHKTRCVATLESEGYDVEVVATGPSAYYSIAMHRFELILVDVDMPGDEGYDTLEALRLLPANNMSETIGVFALASDLTPDQVLRCTNVDADGVLQKPLTTKILRQAIQGRRPAGKTDKPRSKLSWNGSGSPR